jgi:hypothetical protein
MSNNTQRSCQFSCAWRVTNQNAPPISGAPNSGSGLGGNAAAQLAAQGLLNQTAPPISGAPNSGGGLVANADTYALGGPGQAAPPISGAPNSGGGLVGGPGKLDVADTLEAKCDTPA